MPQPPEITPPPAVDLVLVFGVGGGVVRPADDGRDPRRVEAADHRRHEPVLRVPVAELPVLSPAPRAQHIARCKAQAAAATARTRQHHDPHSTAAPKHLEGKNPRPVRRDDARRNAPPAQKEKNGPLDLPRRATEWLAPAETSTTAGGASSAADMAASICRSAIRALAAAGRSELK